jgi:hypothetical protein
MRSRLATPPERTAAEGCPLDGTEMAITTVMGMAAALIKEQGRSGGYRPIVLALYRTLGQ